MTTPRSAPLLVALFAVLAGCSGSGGLTDAAGQPPSETVTPAPVPTDGPVDTPFPPGVSAAGVTDVQRLEDAHLETLTNGPFVERARTVVRSADGSIVLEETYVGRHGTNASAIAFRLRGVSSYPVPSRSLVAADVWGNGSLGARRVVTVDGRVELDTFDGRGILFARPRGGYGSAFRDAETAVVSRRVVDGAAEYVLVAEGVDTTGPWYFRRSFMRTRGEGRIRAVVTGEGTVRRFVVEFPIRIEGRNATLRHTCGVEVGDVTVIRPPWFAEATASEESVPFSPTPAGLTGRRSPSYGQVAG